jgi:hypothetical protein
LSNIGQQYIPDWPTLIKEVSMANTIKAGSILIDEGILLPESLLFESEYCAQGWILVKNLNSYGMKQIVSKAGWSFLYMTGEVKTRIFGSDEEKTKRKAIEQVLEKMRSKKFNCLEITRIVAKRFLGLPYVSVQARPRQIQESPVLFREFFGDRTKSHEIGTNSPQIDADETDIHGLNPCLIHRIDVDRW